MFLENMDNTIFILNRFILATRNRLSSPVGLKAPLPLPPPKDDQHSPLPLQVRLPRKPTPSKSVATSYQDSLEKVVGASQQFLIALIIRCTFGDYGKI